MTLMQLKRDSIEAGIITDAQYDWDGKRLATTSTDATITIRDLDAEGGWVIHDGSEIKAAHAVSITVFFIERRSTLYDSNFSICRSQRTE